MMKRPQPMEQHLLVMDLIRILWVWRSRSRTRHWGTREYYSKVKIKPFIAIVFITEYWASGLLNYQKMEWIIKTMFYDQLLHNSPSMLLTVYNKRMVKFFKKSSILLTIQLSLFPLFHHQKMVIDTKFHCCVCKLLLPESLFARLVLSLYCG